MGSMYLQLRARISRAVGTKGVEEIIRKGPCLLAYLLPRFSYGLKTGFTEL